MTKIQVLADIWVYPSKNNINPKVKNFFYYFEVEKGN